MFSRAGTVTYPTKHTPKALFTPLCPRLLVCQGDYVFMHFSPSFLPFLAVRVTGIRESTHGRLNTNMLDTRTTQLSETQFGACDLDLALAR